MPDWLIPILTVIGGVLGPLLTMQVVLHQANKGTLATIKQQVQHIDDCLDSLKNLVARSTNHDARLTRLEDRYFREGRE